MKSRGKLLAGMGLVLAFWYPSITIAATAKPAERPNVLIVLTDDQGYGDFSCLGNPILKTPNLDKLHDQGIRLTDFHVCPMCTPTRSQIMTGRDCLTTGAYVVCSGHDLLREGLPTMADCFAADMFAGAGYRTGQFGKWHLGGNYPFRPQDRGFQESVCFRGFGIVSSSDYWNNDGYNDWGCEDWVAPNSAHQEEIRRGLNHSGPWHVFVERDGEYRVSLRRWPVEADTAITAGLPAFDGVLGHYPPGKALPIVKARLKVADLDQSKPVGKDDKAVTFTVHLRAGKTTLQTWFYGRSDKQLCGAYCVYVEHSG